MAKTGAATKRARRSTPDRTRARILTNLRGLNWHVRNALEVVNAMIDSIEGGDLAMEADLAVALRALRTIAHSSRSDTRSRGLAQAALKRLRVE